MGYREVYTAANMADEEYNISDKGLGITPEKLSFTVRPGGITEGQFVVAGPPGTAVTGFLTSDNFHMQLRRNSFAENPDRISWRFDAGTLREGEISEGTIGIVSNRGEYRLPFRAEVVQPQITGKEVQEIPHQNTAAERFLSLADEDWGSAVRLFYRKEFAQSLVTDEEKMSYRGNDFYERNGVTALHGVSAEKLNPAGKAVTLSGGEPFCQAEALTVLAKRAHEMGLTVFCYSGFTFEKLMGSPLPKIAQPVITLWVLPESSFNISTAALSDLGLPIIWLSTNTPVSQPITISSGWFLCTAAAFWMARYSGISYKFTFPSRLSSIPAGMILKLSQIRLKSSLRRGEAEAKIIII